MIIKDYQAADRLLEGRVILITGASSGMGAEAARHYAALGATVILSGRNVPRLEAVYDTIEAQGSPQAAILPLDLEKATDRDFEAYAQAIELEFGRLDGLLHSAAYLYGLTPLALQSSVEFDRMMKINLSAPFGLTRALLPLLQQAPDASIIFTLESHGHEPAAYWGPFAIAKHGLEAMLTIWQQELVVHSNLRLNGLLPGPVNSPSRARTHPGELKTLLPTMESLMPLYVYLMGADSRGVKGAILHPASEI